MTLTVTVSHKAGNDYAAKITTSTGEIHFVKPGESVDLTLFYDRSLNITESSVSEADAYAVAQEEKRNAAIEEDKASKEQDEGNGQEETASAAETATTTDENTSADTKSESSDSDPKEESQDADATDVGETATDEVTA